MSEWVELALPTEEVASEIFSWRQDPVIRKASCHECAPCFYTFLKDFHKDYFEVQDLPCFFLRNGEKRLVFVRFRPFQGEKREIAYEISIMVHPNEKRKGYGLKALHIAHELAKEQGVHAIYAVIKEENAPSKALFQKAGYSFLKNTKWKIQTLQGDVFIPSSLFRKDCNPKPEAHVFLVAEIGSNWIVGSESENKKMAKSLIEEVKKAGFDAVKFQTFKAETTYAQGAGKSGYLAARGKDQDIRTILKKHEMPYEDLPFLHGLAKESGLHFMSTAFSEQDFQAVDPYVNFHKVASYEIAYPQLLSCIATSKKPVFLSTGASFMDEIGWAVSFLQERGVKDITLLQCTAAYPAEPSMMNLQAMKTLRKSFSLPVGLSDHSRDYAVAPILAVSYGATVIEKHVTMNCNLPGPDHSFSLEPKEFHLFVEKVRLAEEMIGSGQKEVLPQEEELYFFAKRALQATKEIHPNEEIHEGKNVQVLRPGVNKKGLHPSMIKNIEGKQVKRDIMSGDGIQLEDIL